LKFPAPTKIDEIAEETFEGIWNFSFEARAGESLPYKYASLKIF
jgi:hypothetical protein